MGCLHGACRNTHRNSFPHVYMDFQTFATFSFFFLCFVSLRAIDMLFAYDFAFFSHSFTHSLAHSPARCHLVLQTYSALIAIMSCELYSISISLIFSIIFFGLGFLVCDFNQNALMRVAEPNVKLLVPFMKFAYLTNWIAFKNLRNHCLP